MREKRLSTAKDDPLYGHVLSALHRESQEIAQGMSKDQYVAKYHHHDQKHDTAEAADGQENIDKNNSIGNAYRLIRLMKEDQIQAKEHFYISALHCAAWEYRWEEALEIFSLLKEEPSIETKTLAYQLVIRT